MTPACSCCGQPQTGIEERAGQPVCVACHHRQGIIVNEMIDDWDRARQSAENDLLPAMMGSAVVLTLSPGDKPDYHIALETGYAVLLNKPMIVVSWPGVEAPENLARLARHHIVLRHSLRTKAGRDELQEKLVVMRQYAQEDE